MPCIIYQVAVFKQVFDCLAVLLVVGMDYALCISMNNNKYISPTAYLTFLLGFTSQGVKLLAEIRTVPAWCKAVADNAYCSVNN